MVEYTLPRGLTLRRPTMDDVPIVYELVAAVEASVLGEPNLTIEDVRAGYSEPGVDIATDSWLVMAPDGWLVAEADAWRQGSGHSSVFATVHPDFLGRGVGTYLLRLAEARARDWIAEAPDGARVFVPGQDERRFYAAAQEAFQDRWGHIPPPFESFATWHVERPDVDFSLYHLAMDGEDVAGVIGSQVRPGIGWVNTLAVRRPWRRLGSAWPSCSRRLVRSIGKISARSVWARMRRV
jgi:GNAT superfamily N-acetyltransferase